MSKHKSSQRYIFKISSSRLRKSKWNLNLTIEKSMENEELVSLAESTSLRFISEIEGKKDSQNKINKLKKDIHKIKNEPVNIENKKLLKSKYKSLYELLFVKNYVCVIIDKISDFDRMNSKKGFYINGVKFKRLLATTGGAKNRTVVYVGESVYEELNRRIDNGRNLDMELVPAKLEAYKSLVCSSSIPLSTPSGVLVVNDCETTFTSNVIEIDDSVTKKYPKMRNMKDYPIVLNESDGYGLMLPELADTWAKEVDENYITTSGLCIRNSFCKGMVFTFDFMDFADNVAKKCDVLDAWGHTQDIRNIKLILTTSMLKLWSSYESIEDYLQNCKDNGYTFSATKAIPDKLENERNLNYQFLQSLQLSDENLDRLISPTIEEIKDVLGKDRNKSLLFLKGIHLQDNEFNKGNSDFSKALMIDKEMINDPFVQSRIYQMIRKRIKEAKVGVIKVESNFSIISGDPYSLCQSIFKIPVTGLLKSGEFYSSYWNNLNVDRVACFRAPMTCHNNIRVLNLRNDEDVNRWYRYMKNCTIFNSWDTTTHALNGADKDSDSVLTTNNPIILGAIQDTDAIVCVQKSAEKILVTEKALIQSNKNSFGDEIGSVTNKISSMFDVLANFDEDSKEYKTLMYRIKCGQNYQQNAIDKTKGISSKPMPKEWFDIKAAKAIKNPLDRKLNMLTLANKKPYFFIYIYPYLYKEYKNHINSYEDYCVENFRCNVSEMIVKVGRSPKEEEFVRDYYKYMPVSISDSLMNRICRKIECAFDGQKIEPEGNTFDYRIMKTNREYKQSTYEDVLELYRQYQEELKRYSQVSKADRTSTDEIQSTREVFKQSFKMRASQLCSNEKDLCNIVLDICYNNNNSKQFAWDVCGDTMIDNLIIRNNGILSYPVQDDNGDIFYGGKRFSEEKFTVECEELDGYNS